MLFNLSHPLLFSSFSFSSQDVDRGDMQQFYTRYKEMKRVIRDDAAVDIQRCLRGFLVRCRIARFSGMIISPKGGSGGGGVRGDKGGSGGKNGSGEGYSGYVGDVVCMDVGDGGYMQEKRGDRGGSRFIGDSMVSLSVSTSSTLHTLLKEDDVRTDRNAQADPKSSADQPEFLPGSARGGRKSILISYHDNHPIQMIHSLLTINPFNFFHPFHPTY